ncbi:MAG: coproporphyrinogen III oxidase family protein [Cytophagales bacterium]|nr:coproporphyrinogen III oxidase family protein [Cytophagales bacterium]
MSSIYIHIPFCKQACYYCDFHFSTNQKLKEDLVKALCKEISLQKDYFNSKIDTIYLGGGTPSLLSEKELNQILTAISTYLVLNDKVEITLEANPDDLTKEKLKLLRRAGINRLSIGVQSFDEAHLRFLNRVHNALEAKKSIELAQNAGFDNINIDLIYGSPHSPHLTQSPPESEKRGIGETERRKKKQFTDSPIHPFTDSARSSGEGNLEGAAHVWKKDLETTFKLQIQHISAYCLTIEPKTVFGKWLKKKKIDPVDEDFAAQQYEILINATTQNGFLHYEISNFCIPGYESKHNCNYWQGGQYLGIGPSAHSYNGTNRQFNVSNNAIYISTILENNIPCKIEEFNLKNSVNEYIITRLRTMWGLPVKSDLKSDLRYDLLSTHKRYINNYLKAGAITVENDHIKLTDKGMLIADKIISDLMSV